MNYGIYKDVRNASWQCILDCQVDSLPIKPAKIARYYGIECKKAPGAMLKEHAGEIKNIQGKVYIFYDVDSVATRQRFTVMHELGHHVMGHLKGESLLRSEVKYRPEEEQAADRFAIDMLAPACVLWGLQLRTPEEIAEFCNISMEAATLRAKRMKVLYQRNKFLTHPLERQVYAQFLSFINENR